MAKFTPGVSDIVETANAAVEGGVDAIAIAQYCAFFLPVWMLKPAANTAELWRV